MYVCIHTRRCHQHCCGSGIGIQINRKFEDDLTVLHHAALSGQTSIIKVLIEYDADKDSVVTKFNMVSCK